MKRLLVLILCLGFASAASAQSALKNIAIKNDANAPGGVAVAGAVGNQPEDKIVAHITQLGQKFITDLKMAQSYASFKNANGRLADAAAAPCYGALIPVAELVVNGPPMGDANATPVTPEVTEPGPITKIEKIRIVRIALQDPDLKNACAPLVQDIQSQINQVLGMGLGIARIVTGLGIP